MTELLEQDHLCKAVSRLYPDLERILVQIVVDVVNAQNQTEVGPSVLGVKHVQDIFRLFAVRGDLLIKNEPKK